MKSFTAVVAFALSTLSCVNASIVWVCFYEGQEYYVCSDPNYDGWQYENGRVCVSTIRCKSQGPQYGPLQKFVL